MIPVRIATLLAALLAIASCGGGDDDLDNDLRLRVLHASPDAPEIEYRLDSSIQAVAMGYTDGTRLLPLTPATYDVVLSLLLPGQERTAIFQESLALTAGTDYTLIATGTAGNRQVLRFENPLSAPTPGFAAVQVVHVAPGQPAVDVYLTVPDADLGAAVPLGPTLTFGTDIQRQEIAAGAWRLRLTEAANPANVLYDAGTLPLPSSRDILVAIATNTEVGPSPFVTTLTDGAGFSVVRDAASLAEARVVHVSPDAGAIDVVATPAPRSDGSTPPGPTTLADALPYAALTPYVPLAPDTYAIEAVADADPDTSHFEFAQGLAPGQRITIAAVGLEASMVQRVLTDDNRPVSTAGRLLLYNASPAAGTVDVYLLGTGADLETAPLVGTLAFGTPSSRLGVIPDDYTLAFTETGTKDPVVTLNVPLEAGRVFTVILRDEDHDIAPDGKPVQAILIDDAPPL